MGVSKTIDHIQTKIKIPNPSKEPPTFSKAPNQDLKVMDVLCTFNIKIESQNWKHGCINNQLPYLNQGQIPKPQSGNSSPHKSPKSRHKGHGCSLHLQNKDKEPKFRSGVYQRRVTISKSRLRCQTLVRNLQRPKANDPVQNMILMSNLKDPPATSKAPREYLKDMDIFFIFKIKIESQNSKHWFTKDQ